MTYQKVAIIILNWNGKKDTIECLESLKRITYHNYDILLVDNGSTDGSVEFFRERYPGMEIIENEKNLGFAEGNNVGIRRAIEKGEDYVLLLNNDTVVDPEFLGELIKVAESDLRIGIIGPMVYHYYPQNRIQSAGVKIHWNTGKQDLLRSNEIDNGIFSEKTQVDSVSGCALLAKCELFENVGYLKKEYFAYWEETDWCVRARKAGYKVICVTRSKIWHKGSITTDKIEGFSVYHLTRNRLWFMKQNASRIEYISFFLYFFLFYFWYNAGIYIIYHKNLTAFTSFLKGVRDGIKTFHE